MTSTHSIHQVTPLDSGKVDREMEGTLEGASSSIIHLHRRGRKGLCHYLSMRKERERQHPRVPPLLSFTLMEDGGRDCVGWNGTHSLPLQKERQRVGECGWNGILSLPFQKERDHEGESKSNG